MLANSPAFPGVTSIPPAAFPTSWCRGRNQTCSKPSGMKYYASKSFWSSLKTTTVLFRLSHAIAILADNKRMWVSFLQAHFTGSTTCHLPELAAVILGHDSRRGHWRRASTANTCDVLSHPQLWRGQNVVQDTRLFLQRHKHPEPMRAIDLCFCPEITHWSNRLSAQCVKRGPMKGVA